MKVKDLGEFGLIERLTGMLPAEGSPDLIVGIGDDAAVWRAGSEYLIATTDTMMEGVHFVAGQAPWADVGWKALAVNVSDIAAMGGTPLFALVTLALPQSTSAEDVEALYRGLSECAQEYRVAIVGGDTVRAPQVSVTVALVGSPAYKARVQYGEQDPMILRRDKARPGDFIAVTGPLGDSAAGLRLLQKGSPRDNPLVDRHLRPRPPVVMGYVAVVEGVECAIDISDGLLQDIGHICEASGVGAVLRAADVPISDALRSTFPDDALRLACTGGEDYELVLVGDMVPLLSSSPAIIGEIIDDSEHRVRLLDGTDNEITFERGGWDAFQ